MAKSYIFDELDKEKILQLYHLVASNDGWKITLDRLIADVRNYLRVFKNYQTTQLYYSNSRKMKKTRQM